MRHGSVLPWFFGGLGLMILGSFTTIIFVAIGTIIMAVAGIVAARRRIKFYQDLIKGRRAE